jgi:hypothetical protein
VTVLTGFCFLSAMFTLNACDDTRCGGGSSMPLEVGGEIEIQVSTESWRIDVDGRYWVLSEGVLPLAATVIVVERSSRNVLTATVDGGPWRWEPQPCL